MSRASEWLEKTRERNTLVKAGRDAEADAIISIDQVRAGPEKYVRRADQFPAQRTAATLKEQARRNELEIRIALRKKLEASREDRPELTELELAQEIGADCAGDPAALAEALGVPLDTLASIQNVQAARAEAAPFAAAAVQRATASLSSVLPVNSETIAELQRIQSEAALEADPFAAAIRMVGRFALEQHPEAVMAAAMGDEQAETAVLQAAAQLEREQAQAEQQRLEALDVAALERELDGHVETWAEKERARPKFTPPEDPNPENWDMETLERALAAEGVDTNALMKGGQPTFVPDPSPTLVD